MVPPLTSFVWRHFTKIDKDHVSCNTCSKELRYHSCTTNMKSHLKSRHSHILEEEEERMNRSNNLTYTDEEGDEKMASTSISVRSIESGHVEASSVGQVLNYHKLVVPVSMRSIYWKCYGFPASSEGEILTKEKIVCLLCKAIISYNRNTSNLRMHLQNRHSEELAQLELSGPFPTKRKTKAKARVKKEAGNLYATEMDGSLVLENNLEISSEQMTLESGENYVETEHPRQMKVMINKRGNKNMTSSGKPHVTLFMPGMSEQSCTIESLHPFMIPIENKTISDAVAEFIVTDMQLPDVVEGKGFHRLIATLRSPCEIPSKSKLMEEIIPRMYDMHKESFQESMQTIKTEMALTVEEWDTISGETFVTFSVCFHQEKDENLHIKVLSTVHCPSSADISYWNAIFDNLLDEWSINVGKIKGVVCGNCRHDLMDVMVQKGLIVIPCLVQTLQEVCSRVCFEQDDVREILAKFRSIIYLIFKNNTALAALRIQDHLMSLDETPLMSDYPRVWISTYSMMEAVMARRQVLPTILENIEPGTYDKEAVTITELEWSLIQDVLSVLEPFKVTMMTLSEEKVPQVSLLKPLLWQLISCHLKAKSEDTPNAQVFKNALNSLLSEKYNDPTVNQLLQIATALDPRFKSLPNCAEECQAALDGPIKQALTSLIEEIPEEEMKPIEEAGTEKKKPRLSGMLMLLGEIKPTTTSNTMTAEARANLELVQYKSETTATLDQCPISWWHRAVAKCPHLSRLAGQYTCIPATALPPCRIPLEQQISYDLRRNSLPSEVLDRVIFLNANRPG